MMRMREIGSLPRLKLPERKGYKSVWGESISRVRLGVLYMVHDILSFLFEYFSTEILVLHANRCRAVQAG
jgi:hypothetical protein